MATIKGTSGDDTLTGGSGADVMIGLAGNDVLRGMAGNNRLDGGAGDDTMSGGAGRDLYRVQSFGDVVIEAAGGGLDSIIATGTGSNTWRLAANVENLVVRDSFQAYGNELDNVIRSDSRAGKTVNIDGRAGNDTLIGGNGNEWFNISDLQSVGRDVINGKGGDNKLSLFGGTEHTSVIDFTNGTASGQWTHGRWTVSFSNIDWAAGGTGEDLLIADDAGRRMFGMAGEDTLRGGWGRDYLGGDPGNDILVGSTGNDTLSGGQGSDTLVGGDGSDSLAGGTESDYLRGDGGNDVLQWDPLDRSVSGGAGTDVLKVFLTQHTNIDLTAVADSVITSIERIDMRGPEMFNGKLTLNKSDVLAMSSTSALIVFGDAGDSVDIVSPFIYRGQTGQFHKYEMGSATLFVHENITDIA
jgi:Ca2+-binding RTX toxin-like protein